MPNNNYDMSNGTQRNNPRTRVSDSRSNDPRRAAASTRRTTSAGSSAPRSAVPRASYPASSQNPRVRQASISRDRASANSRASYAQRPASGGTTNRVTYGDRTRYSTTRKQRKTSRGIVGFVVLLLAALIGGGGFIAYQIVNPAEFEVTINESTYTLTRGTTINNVLEQGLVTPQAGNLMAVDGTTLEAGGGERFNATVDGEEVTDGETVLRKNNVITIEDGDDIDEPYVVSETLTIEPERIIDGMGAIHLYVNGSAGTTEIRTGETSGKTAEVILEPVVNYGFMSYNAEVGDDKVIALTFDDGPWPTTTDQILDILDQYNAKATFFVLGEQIDDYSSSVKRAYEAGHQICSHTWDHASGSGQGVNLTYMSAEEQIAEITKSYEAIESVTGAEASHVFRAPGGNYYGDIIWTLQPYVTAEIGWNVDTQDWARPGSDVIASRIKAAKPGEIVLMHDGGGDRSQTVEALRVALPYLVEQGYTFVTIDELLAYGMPE